MGTALLLVIVGLGALAAGVLLGRYYVPDDRELRRAADRSNRYVRALNHSLHRDPDAAVAELREAVKTNVDDVEPYFALGALFRSQGDWERAIRVHQTIGMREDADRDVRHRALYELGLDFRAAGMPRRATRAMEECLAAEPAHEGALRGLASLYEEQGRYAEAATAWRRLGPEHRGGARELHLVAAAVQLAVDAGDHGRARKLLGEAAGAAPNPHIEVAAGLLAQAEGDVRGACARVRAAIAAAPHLAGFLVPLLLDLELEAAGSAAAAPAAGDADAPGPAAATAGDADDAVDADSGDDGWHDASAADEAVVRRVADDLSVIAEEHGSDPYLELSVADLYSRCDPERALDVYREVAESHPDLLPARVAAARLALATGDADAVQAELVALVAAGEGALSWAARGVWRCTHCGHRDDMFFWRCDQCRRWGQLRLDVGRASQDPDPASVRDRREAVRPLALPAPALAPSASAGIAATAVGVLDRAGSLISTALRAVRGGGRDSASPGGE